MSSSKWFILTLFFLLTSCVTKPPRNVDNICHVFTQYPQWYRAAQDAAYRWKVPIPVQMAIIHQESKFNSRAKPPRSKLFAVLPWGHQSSAYGYTQALSATWKVYKNSTGYLFSSRHDFTDAVDFVGWYADQANRRAGIARDDVYSLYLAYHEGIGGYQRKTYLSKPWLINVARKVTVRSQIYAAQLSHCKI